MNHVFTIKPFNQIAKDKTWWNPKVKKEDYLVDGKFPIVDQWQNYIGWYTDDENLLCKVDLPCIIFWDHTRIFKYIDFPFVLWADGVKVLKCEPWIDSKYVYHYFRQAKLWGKKWYNRNFKYLKELQIPLPDLATQKAIAAKLDAIQELIDQKKQVIHKTDELAKAIFVDMFGDPVMNEKGNFGDKNIVEIIDWDRWKSYPKSDDFSNNWYCWFLNTSNVKKWYFNFDKMDFVSKEKDISMRKWKLSREDVVLTTRWTVWNVAYYSSDIPYEHIRINSWMVILRPNIKILNPIYLVKYILSDHFEGQKIRQLSGSAQPQLPITVLRNIQIPLPPLPLQQQFADTISQLQQVQDDNKLALAKLEELFASTMQECFS